MSITFYKLFIKIVSRFCYVMAESLFCNYFTLYSVALIPKINTNCAIVKDAIRLQ